MCLKKGKKIGVHATIICIMLIISNRIKNIKFEIYHIRKYYFMNCVHTILIKIGDFSLTNTKLCT